MTNTCQGRLKSISINVYDFFVYSMHGENLKSFWLRIFDTNFSLQYMKMEFFRNILILNMPTTSSAHLV